MLLKLGDPLWRVIHFARLHIYVNHADLSHAPYMGRSQNRRHAPDNMLSQYQHRRLSAHHATHVVKQPIVDFSSRLFGRHLNFKRALDVQFHLAPFRQGVLL
jgi:hypothetical protein